MATKNVLIFLAFTIIHQEGQIVSAQSVCRTDVCRTTAARIRSAIDFGVRPCDDFYQFACGSFMRNTHVPVGRLQAGPFIDAFYKQQDILKDIFETAEVKPAVDAQTKSISLYKACKRSVSTLKERTANMDFLKQMLKDFLNGWPLSTNNWNASGFDLTTALARITSRLDQGFFISPKVLPDVGNSTKHTLTIIPESPSQATSPFVEQIIKNPDEWLQEMRGEPTTGYQSTPLMGIIREVACIMDPNCRSNPNLISDAETLHNILTNVGYSLRQKTFFSSESMDTIVKNLYTVSKSPEVENSRFDITRLNREFPSINWNTYFNILFENTDFVIKNDFQVLVAVEEIGQVLNSFQEASKRELSLFFGWHIISKWGVLLSPQLRSLLSPTQDQTDVCLQVVNGAMGYAVARMYEDHHVDNSTVKEVTGLVNELKSAFRNLLKESSWMDNDTKTHATKKIDNMVSSVSAPDWIRNNQKLNDYYSKLDPNDTSDFRVGFKKVKNQYFANQVARLNQPVDKINNWPIEIPAQTNAFYFVPGNSMYFCSGMLQFPFFETGRPRAVNFGSLGYVVGHEITHGFDVAGRMMNDKGEHENWWSENSEKSFLAGANCFVKQYGSLREPMTGMMLDGNQTLGENIADNGGVRAAFKAYKQKNSTDGELLVGLEQFSEDQLFFLSAALTYCTQSKYEFMAFQVQRDKHSPNMYRAIVPFQNSDDFSRAFNCPKNSFMNPTTKCRVW